MHFPRLLVLTVAILVVGVMGVPVPASERFFDWHDHAKEMGQMIEDNQPKTPTPNPNPIPPQGARRRSFNSNGGREFRPVEGGPEWVGQHRR